MIYVRENEILQQFQGISHFSCIKLGCLVLGDVAFLLNSYTSSSDIVGEL